MIFLLASQSPKVAVLLVAAGMLTVMTPCLLCCICERWRGREKIESRDIEEGMAGKVRRYGEN